MISNLFPLWAALIANVIAQVSKPFFYYIKTNQWRWTHIFESGGFPSSHTATASSLALATGIVDHFQSSAFAVAVIVCLVICYDAANVRYYSGQNIGITQQLVKDIELLTSTKLTDPVYQTRLKSVLGHKWIEVGGGFIWGIATTGILYLLFY